MSRISLLLFGSGLLLNTAFGFAAAIAPVPFSSRIRAQDRAMDVPHPIIRRLQPECFATPSTHASASLSVRGAGLGYHPSFTQSRRRRDEGWRHPRHRDSRAPMTSMKPSKV
jgi:hypothetical protein